jgi:hypothetical protein
MHEEQANQTIASGNLGWRIPTAGDPRLLRFGLAQVGLATIVAALVLAMAAPRAWLGWGLAGLVPLAVFMAYRKWNRYQQSLAGPDNVRIDDAGLHWHDASGQEQSFRRADVTAFRIAREEDTLREVPALTLYLAGGFESQPLELHPPASDDAVRQFLAGRWGLAERPQATTQTESPGYEQAFDVYSECHDDFQEWHWEGTREQLAQLFGWLASAAEALPLPPRGAKPLLRTALLRRRQPLRLRVAHSSVPHFEFDLLAAPGTVLIQIADLVGQRLADATTPSDHKFDVPLSAKSRWTFHLHVRD